jgi:hypothetical protein
MGILGTNQRAWVVIRIFAAESSGGALYPLMGRKLQNRAGFGCALWETAMVHTAMNCDIGTACCGFPTLLANSSARTP